MAIKKDAPAPGSDIPSTQAELNDYIAKMDSPDFDPDTLTDLLMRYPEPGFQTGKARFDKEAEFKKTPMYRARTTKLVRAAYIAIAATFLLAAVAVSYGDNPLRFFTDTIIFHEQISGNLTLSDGNAAGYSSLQEALTDHGITESLCPTWIPTDFAIARVVVRDSEKTKRLAADYSAERGTIRIQVAVCNGTDLIRSEEIAEGGYTYTHDGTTFYILPNTMTAKAYWHIGRYYCTISGNVTTDELEQMIDSIQ